MTQDQKIIRNKLGLLKLAQTLGSVSDACKVLGFSRDSFYRFKELHETGGEAALAEISRKKPNFKNRADPKVEQAVVEFAIEQPAYGQVRVANEVKKRGLSVSPAGVRTIWLRHDLQTFQQRLKALSASPGRPDPHRGSGPGTREGEAGQRGARRDRDRTPWLPRRAGHLLCRQPEGRGAYLPADLHRHVQQVRPCQAVRPQARDHRSRHAQ